MINLIPKTNKLSQEIKTHFNSATDFSVRNLKYMRAFAKEYPNYPFVQVSLAQTKNKKVQVSLAQTKNKKVQVSLAQITWYHHISLLTKVNFKFVGADPRVCPNKKNKKNNEK